MNNVYIAQPDQMHPCRPAGNLSRRPLAGTIAALLIAGAIASSAGAQPFAAVLNLGSLDGSNGFRLVGSAADDFSGRSVSAAGDINGDGFDDVIIGATEANPGGVNFAGSSFVVFGRGSAFAASMHLGGLNGSNGFRIDGVAAADRAGYSARAAGDINGDGLDDVVVGATGASPNGNSRAGSAYVVFGRHNGFPAALNLGLLDGAIGFRLDGDAEGSLAGLSTSGAGDINGDGIADLIVGALAASPDGRVGAGSSFLVFGRATGFPASLGLGNLNGSDGFRIDGAEPYDRSGISVRSAGDINGDGIADLVVGANWASRAGNTNAGSSFVVFGRSGGFPATLNLGSLNGGNGFRLDGAASGDWSGFSADGAGDVNGDGVADLIVGAPYADPAGNNRAGSSFVVFGRRSGFPDAMNLGSLSSSDGFRIDGLEAAARVGRAVSSAGDVNGDGIGDLIMGAPSVPASFNVAGSSFVVFGRSSGFPLVLELALLNGEDGFRLDGVTAGDGLGSSVSAAGDINGDGVDDLIIGAPQADLGGGNYAGTSYVVFGRDVAAIFKDQFE